MFGTKFNIFCSPQPNGIFIKFAKFGMLGPKMSPANQQRINRRSLKKKGGLKGGLKLLMSVITNCGYLYILGTWHDIARYVDGDICACLINVSQIEKHRFISILRFSFSLEE